MQGIKNLEARRARRTESHHLEREWALRPARRKESVKKGLETLKLGFIFLRRLWQVFFLPTLIL